MLKSCFPSDLIGTMESSKSLQDYMTEMNRLFPEIKQNEGLQSPNLYNTASYTSPFNQSSMIGNRSSSSADSTSPESYVDIFPFPNIRPQNEQFYMSRQIPESPTSSDTPFLIKRQRPIVGRKIFNTSSYPTQGSDALKPMEHLEFNAGWNGEDFYIPHTPPNQTKTLSNSSNLYELFPSENKNTEFRTPVKSEMSSSYNTSSVNVSPNSSTYSPISSRFNQSPSRFNLSPNRFNQSPSRTNIPTCFSPTPSNMCFSSQSNYAASASSRFTSEGQSQLCTFCRKNGETPMVYMTHTVRERVGNRSIVKCPILRNLKCEECGAYGDDAHTITYCPVLRNSNNGLPLQSTTITLKNTRIKSNGRRRF